MNCRPRLAFALVLTAVVALAAPLRSLHAQDLADSQEPRAPRFLVHHDGRPVVIEPARFALLARRVDARFTKVTLAAALQSLASQSGARIAYSRDEAGLDRTVHMDARGITLTTALTELLFDTNLDVVVAGPDRLAIVPRREEHKVVGGVEGTVTDSAEKTPVPGVEVAVLGTRLGATTGADGRYAIRGVPAGAHTLLARRIGYRGVRRTVEVIDGKTVSADFSLQKVASTLDEVIVAGNYVESSRREAPVPIATFSEAELHRPTRNRIDQLFRGDIPGVVGYDNGSQALGLVAYVRGSASLDDQNLLKVYVDGIEMPASMLVSSVDLSGIERAELLRGPQASTIYGANASGGVLLLFTKNGRRGPPRVSGSVAAGVTESDFVSGTPTSMEHRVNIAGGGDGFTYSFGGSYDRFGEVLPQGDWKQFGGYGRAVLTQGKFSLGLTASYSQRVEGSSNFPAFATLGVPSLVAPVNTDGYIGNQLLGVTFTYFPSDHWLHQVTVGFNNLSLNSDNYAPHNAFPGDTLRFADLETDEQLSARYVASTHRALSRSVSSSSTAGVEVSRRTFNYFQGSGLYDPQSAGSAQSDFIEAYRVTNNAGFFAQQVFGFSNRLFLTGGLRAEDNSNVGSSEGLIWAPRAGAAYTFPLSDRIALKPRGSFGKSIRPPQPGQAGAGQSSFSIQQPNPTLRAEVSSGVDAGFDLEYREGTVTFEATYFNQDAKDLIGLTALGVDPATSRSINQYQNVGTVNNKGVEFGLGVRVGPLDARASFSTVKSRIKSLAADYTGDQQVGDEMRNVARRAGGGTVGFNFRPLFGRGVGRDARLEFGLTYVGGRRSVDLLGVYQCLYTGGGCRGPVDPSSGGPTFGTLRDYEQEIDPFTKIRIGFSHPLSRSLEGFLNIENLTNDQVGEWITIAPSRGRTVLVGVRFGQ